MINDNKTNSSSNNKKSADRIIKLIATAPLIVGLWMMLFPLLDLIPDDIFNRDSSLSSAVGQITIVAYDKSSPDSHDATCKVSYLFKVDNKSYIGPAATNKLQSNNDNCSLAPGGSINIKYKSADPSVNEISGKPKNLAYNLLSFLALVPCGVAMVILSILMWRNIRKVKMNQRVDIEAAVQQKIIDDNNRIN